MITYTCWLHCIGKVVVRSKVDHLNQLARLREVDTLWVAWVVGEIDVSSRLLFWSLKRRIEIIRKPSNIDRCVVRNLGVRLEMVVDLRESTQLRADPK